MKRTSFIITVSLCSTLCFAQLKVYQNGNVGIGSTLTTSSSNLNIGNRSYDNNYKVSLLSSTQASSSTYNIGIEGWASPANPISTGRTIGVRGIAGNCTTGYNYGVLGCLVGNRNGAGVYGAASVSLGGVTDGKYAGYFEGDVKVTRATKAFLVNPNDFTSANSGSAIQSPLSIVNGLAPKLYSFINTQSADTLSPRGDGTGGSRAWEYHYAFNTTGLSQLDPLLVTTDASNKQYVNCTELIPVLVAAIQEISEMVDDLQAANSYNMDYTNDINSPLFGAANYNCILYQNNPNPFTENTVIKYSVPENVGDAWLYVFDMQGTMLKQLRLDTKTDRIILQGGDLKPGMYLYSLIVNGREVDTKRMILSK